MSKVNMPNPLAPARSPMDDPEAQRQRQIASDTAMADAKIGGRQSTIMGGAVVTQEEQAKKNAARSALGLGS